jgi:hypothetical protein
MRPFLQTRGLQGRPAARCEWLKISPDPPSPGVTARHINTSTAMVTKSGEKPAISDRSRLEMPRALAPTGNIDLCPLSARSLRSWCRAGEVIRSNCKRLPSVGINNVLHAAVHSRRWLRVNHVGSNGARYVRMNLRSRRFFGSARNVCHGRLVVTDSTCAAGMPPESGISDTLH